MVHTEVLHVTESAFFEGDVSLVSGEVQIIAHFRVKEEGVANPTVKRAVKAAEITQ